MVGFMAYRSTYSGTLSVDPPLGRREIIYLRRLNVSSGRGRRPGDHCPWSPTDDGTMLAVSDEFGTAEPVAEWASYLRTHLLGAGDGRRHDRESAGFTVDHRLTGTVHVRGQSHGDQWTLVVDDIGVVVHREHLPCPACWSEVLICARPSAAYRFQHPVRAANLIDGTDVDLDPGRYEVECRSTTWAPVGRTRRSVEWPWSPDLSSGWWIDLEATPHAVPFNPRQFRSAP